MSNMRFLADMGISPATVTYLRNSGHNAVHLNEENLQTISDSDILIKARHEDRIVLTSDLDFGYLLAVGGNSLPSVILFRLSNMKPMNVNRHLDLVLERYSEQLRTGAVVVVTDSHLRVRLLPIGRE